MIYEYKCNKCGLVQDKWHKIADKNDEPCEKCNAKSKHLNKMLSRPTHHGHGSWSRWQV